MHNTIALTNALKFYALRLIVYQIFYLLSLPYNITRIFL